MRPLRLPLLLFFLSAVAVTCGPFFPEAQFVLTDAPGIPAQEFAAGQAAVFQPSWELPYRILAYRLFSAQPFSPAEREQLAALSPNLRAQRQPPDDLGAPWIQARTLVSGVPALSTLDTYSESADPFQYFPNCLDDAFSSAATRLRSRLAHYSPASADMKDWVLAQDRVFSACKTPIASPIDLPAPHDALLRYDRAYQNASLAFYSFHFDDADHAFSAIAQQAASPYAKLARYLILRNAIRRASTAPEPACPDPCRGASQAALEKARSNRARLDAQALHLADQLLADPSMASLRPAIEDMRQLILVRTDPQQVLRQTAQRLLVPAGDPRLAQDLDQYVALSHRDLPAVTPAGDDLALWIAAASTNPPAFMTAQWALARWRKRKTSAWLIAALLRAAANGTVSSELLAAAAVLPPTDPAYLTVQYQRARYLASSKQSAAARQLLQPLLARAGLSPSDRNLFASLRAQVATSLNDFLSFAAQPQVADHPRPQDVSALDRLDRGRMLTPPAAAVLNRCLPIDRFAALATDPQFPGVLRPNAQLAAFTRAFILNDSALQRTASRQLAAGDTQAAPIMRDYLAAPDRFAAAFALLQLPAANPLLSAGYTREATAFQPHFGFASIDNYRANWWPPDPRMTSEYGAKLPSPACPDYLSASPASTVAALRIAASDAQSLIISIILEHVRRAPGDPRNPQALALAVRMARFSPTPNPTLSQAAFTLLHQRFPNSEWAQRTPYWYGQ